MKYRNLGKHGIKVSEISIGTMYYGSYISKKNALLCLEEAVNQGINYIDSADRYGIFDSDIEFEKRIRAESILGEFLKEQERTDLVIGSKVFYKMRESMNSGGLSRKHIREGIQDSLNHLQTDYLDIYYCHRPDRSTPLEETVLTMSNLIDEGLINYWGTSWWPPTLVERAIWIAKNLGAHPPHVEQPPYHLHRRFIEVDLLELASYHGLGLVTFGALAGSLLTDKYLKGIPKGSRATKVKELTPEVLEIYIERARQLLPIAESLEIPLSHLALAWTLRHPEVSSTLTGASKPEHVASNTEACEVTLSKEVLEQIENVLDNKPVSPFR